MKSILFMLAVCLLFISCENDFSESRPNEEVFADQNIPVPEKSISANQRKIIQTGDISFQVKDVKKTKQQVNNISEKLDGYISSENISNYPGKLEYSVTVKVPAKNFNLLIREISDLAENIDDKNINAEDVTLSYIDLEARLSTKKQMEKRLLDLLNKGNEMKDLIVIEKELQNTRSEIESMEAVLRNMQHKISYSTLHIRFYKPIPKTVAFASEMKSSFLSGWNIFLMFLIGVTHLWPFMVLITLFAVIIIIRQKRKNRLNKI